MLKTIVAEMRGLKNDDEKKKEPQKVKSATSSDTLALDTGFEEPFLLHCLEGTYRQFQRPFFLWIS